MKKRLEMINERIERAAEKAGKKREDITLVCVSKTKPFSMIEEAFSLGEFNFAENKAQEVRDKWEEKERLKGAILHFIGHLQTNKIKYLTGKIDLIHSLDSIKLLRALDSEYARECKNIRCLLEIHSGDENKYGVHLKDVPAFLEEAARCKNIKVEGMMTMGPLNGSEAQTRSHFELVRKLFVDTTCKKYDNVCMSFLSMGMSSDFEAAIESGSNMVRVGTAIFGQKN